MGWSGQTYQVPFDRGGFTFNKNTDLSKPEQMVWPSKNINLNKGGREPRGGTIHVDTVANSGETVGNGIYDFTLRSGTQHIMRAWRSGKIYNNASGIIATGMSSANPIHFETANNTLYMSDGEHTPKIWSGSGSASAMASAATGWSTNAPFQCIMHGKWASERMWAICKDGVYAAGSGSIYTDFSDAHVVYIPIETGDSTGLLGAVTYGDKLFVHGRHKFYAIDDGSTDVSEWGYSKAAWDGGAAHWRVVVNTPRGLIAMAEDGDIYIVTAVADYGDYKSTSIARPAFIDGWIKENINVSSIASFHAVHDPYIRAVKWFVKRNGASEIDTALVFFYDRDPIEAWSIHDNRLYDSGYNASSSCVVRKSAGTYRVYTQDYAGMVWEQEYSTLSDNGSGYYKGFKTAVITADNARQTKKFSRGWISLMPVGNYDLNIRANIDGTTAMPTQRVNMGVNAKTIGHFVLGVDQLQGQDIIEMPFEIGTTGKRIDFEIWNNEAGQNFFLSTLMLDFKPTGSRADR
jgi:hypothetical protein